MSQRVLRGEKTTSWNIGGSRARNSVDVSCKNRASQSCDYDAFFTIHAHRVDNIMQQATTLQISTLLPPTNKQHQTTCASNLQPS